MLLTLTQPQICGVKIVLIYKYIVRQSFILCGTLQHTSSCLKLNIWNVDINGGWLDSAKLIACGPIYLGRGYDIVLDNWRLQYKKLDNPFFIATKISNWTLLPRKIRPSLKVVLKVDQLFFLFSIMFFKNSLVDATTTTSSASSWIVNEKIGTNS